MVDLQEPDSMSMRVPTRNEAIEIARKLVDGKISPKEAAEWVESLYTPGNQAALDELKQNDPLLEEFIGTLGMAYLPGDSKDTLLYNKEDFQSWLDEFLEETKKSP